MELVTEKSRVRPERDLRADLREVPVDLIGAAGTPRCTLDPDFPSTADLDLQGLEAR